MNVLIVGGGGREHALAQAIAASPLLTRLLVAPGNPGMAELAQCLPCHQEDDIITAALDHAIDLVVIGPEAPLVAGLADRLEQNGISVFGPGKNAAMLEGSKTFAREFCARHRIAQPQWCRFTDSAEAIRYIKAHHSPSHVIKADGLAAGKGVVVAATRDEAIAAIRSLLDGARFGEAGASVLIEETLTGVEASLFALCDGDDALMIGSAQDYKRAHEGNKGPNTGGMGAISPAPALDEATLQTAWREIVLKTVHGMKADGVPYRGFLYAGLMITGEGPKVIEFNCRFGDPEAEAILPRLESDLLEALMAAVKGELHQLDLRFRDLTAVTVVMANRGYPDATETGGVISGLDEHDESSLVFHAGTTRKNDSIIATGGRVLAVTGLGGNRKEARAAAYKRVSRINWPGCFYRNDIAD